MAQNLYLSLNPLRLMAVLGYNHSRINRTFKLHWARRNYMTRTTILAGALAAFLALVPAALCAEIAGWRTDWTGQYPEDIPPLTWSADKNVVWKVATKKWSNATVVIHKDKLFYGEEPDTLVCADKKDGQELWRVRTTYEELLSGGLTDAAKKQQEEIAALSAKDKEFIAEDRRLNAEVRKDPSNQELKKQLGKVRQERNQVRRKLQALQRRSGSRLPATHNTNGYTSATPLVDGRRVYIIYGSGAAASYDLEGNRQWARIVGRPKNGWGHSASPVLADGTLILHIAGEVYGLDPDTGETRWTAASGQFWGTPLPFAIGKRAWAVLTTGGVVVRASDGKILAKGIGAMPWSSPVARDGILYIADTNGAFAYRIPESDQEPVTFEKLWQTAVKRDRYYSSPIVHDGLLYNVTQRGQMTVLDITNGKVVYEHSFRLGGTFFPSITLAGAFLFISSDTGKTVLFLPGREYREVGLNQLDGFRSNLVFEGTRIYLRTNKYLYCLAENS
jgi:outer membrane protein assembly factor BamB